MGSLESFEDLASMEKVTQLAQKGGSASELAFALQGKFLWNNMFDLMKLHCVFREAFSRGRMSLQSIAIAINTEVDKHMREESPMSTLLQTHMA